MPVLEEASLKGGILLGNDLHQVVWANGKEDAYGGGRFLMLGVVLR